MAIVFLKQPYNGHRALVLSHDKAEQLQQAINHPETATAKQRAFIDTYYKKLYMGKSRNQIILDTKPAVQQSWVDVDLGKD